MGIINQVNEKEKREKEMQEMQGGLTPEDENKDTLDNSRNNMTSNTTNKGINKNLFASMRPGGLKSIGQINDDSFLMVRNNSLSQKEGFKEEQELKERYMQDKEKIMY